MVEEGYNVFREREIRFPIFPSYALPYLRSPGFLTEARRNPGNLYFPIVCALFFSKADWIRIKEKNELCIHAKP